MNKKKIKKIFLYVFGSIITVVVILLSCFFFIFYSDYDVDKNKYPHYIGYINQEKALLNTEYSLCNKDKIYFRYSGAGLAAFKGTKKRFRKFVLSKYNHQLYKDSGYVSLRFLVNCEGNAGWFEIVEMNLDLEEKKLNNNMVNELLELTSNTENWNTLGHKKEEKHDYYMYILYRIENGKIVEILP